MVLLIADSLRVDHLACGGNKWLQCENINNIAGQACHFTEARVRRPDCRAVRLELVSGLGSARFAGGLASAGGLAKSFTLPSLLRSKGCQTGLITDHRRVVSVYRRCCDFDFILYQPGQADDPQLASADPLTNPFEEGAGREVLSPQFAPAADQIRRYMRNQSGSAGAGHPTERLFQLAAECIDRLSAKENWFLLVDSFGLLQPWDAPDSFCRYRPEDQVRKLAWLGRQRVSTDQLTDDQVRFLRCAYADSCLFYDHALTPLIEALNRHAGIHLFFASDHGVLIGDEGSVGFDADSSADAVTRQVLLVAGPEVAAGGNHQPVRPADLYATLLALGGVPPPFACDGRPLDAVIK